MYHQNNQFLNLINASRCCLNNITTTRPDSLGLQFALLECEQGNHCKDKTFCLTIKRQIELELNRRSEVANILSNP